MTATIISVSIAVLGGVIGLLGWLRNKRQDDNGDGRQSGQILTDIGYIKSGIDDIKAEQRSQRDTNIQFAERLAACEQSEKQAHKRIDHLERVLEDVKE